MKKLVALVLSLVLILGVLAGCVDQGETTAAPATTPAATTPGVTQTVAEGLTGELSVLSFTNELKVMLIAFTAKNPELVISYEQIPTQGNEFQQKALAVATTDSCPDVIALEAAFVKTFVEHDSLLLDISDLKATADAMGTYANTIEVGTDAETGEIRAYSYQNTPGAVFYRRSLAKQYFGTDDPVEIQKLMSDWDKFTAMAETLKTASSGKVKMISGVDEFRWPFFAAREDPWVVDDALVIDPKLDELMDLAKTFGDNGYTAKINQWEEGWMPSMNGALTTAAGEEVEVFCYFMPTWGLSYLLGNNAIDTKGDYAMCIGPDSWQWGGTWVGVMKNAKNPDNAKEFVKFVALDAENLKSWATGVYTHEFLANINAEMAGPAGDGELFQAGGDFVSSKIVVDELTPLFKSDMLAGQSNYEVFGQQAELCSAKLLQGTDEEIQNMFQAELRNYAYTGITMEAAYDNFKNNVAGTFPLLTVD